MKSLGRGGQTLHLPVYALTFLLVRNEHKRLVKTFLIVADYQMFLLLSDQYNKERK